MFEHTAAHGIGSNKAAVYVYCMKYGALLRKYGALLRMYGARVTAVQKSHYTYTAALGLDTVHTFT